MHALRRERLSNGLPVILAPLPHLHTVQVVFSVRAGSRFETPADSGLSHVVEHMLFRGSQKRPSSAALNLAIEELGGTLDAATHVDFTELSLSLPASQLEEGLMRLAEIVAAPIFADFEVEKKILREELLDDLDEDGHDIDVDNFARRQLFGPHPLGQSITGPLENVMRFTVDDLRRHHLRHYVAKNSSIAIAGAFSADEASEVLVRAFSLLRSGVRADPVVAPSGTEGARFRTLKHADSQTDVRVSYLTPGERDAHSLALHLIEHLVDGGMSARLQERIVDRLGLAYHAFAHLDPYDDCGVFDLGATVAHENVPDIVAAFVALMETIAEERVSIEELDRIKRRYLWSLDALLDDAASLASFYATNAIFEKDTTLATLAEKIRRVGPDEVHALASRFFTRDRAHVACVGMVGERRAKKIRTALGLA
jgi:predicted Zn-dependent peptidase